MCDWMHFYMLQGYNVWFFLCFFQMRNEGSVRGMKAGEDQTEGGRKRLDGREGYGAMFNQPLFDLQSPHGHSQRATSPSPSTHETVIPHPGSVYVYVRVHGFYENVYECVSLSQFLSLLFRWLLTSLFAGKIHCFLLKNVTRYQPFYNKYYYSHCFLFILNHQLVTMPVNPIKNHPHY